MKSLLFLLLLLTACNTSSSMSVVAIDESFLLSSTVISEGTKVLFINEGSMEHQLTVLSGNRIIASTEKIKPNHYIYLAKPSRTTSKRLLTLNTGFYTLRCLLPGHIEMRTITVE